MKSSLRLATASQFRRNRALMAAAMVSTTLAFSHDACASSALGLTTWIGASDTWYSPANWSNNALPALTDDAFIDNGSTVTINDPALTATANTIVLGESTGFSGALVVSDGTLTTVTDLRVGGNSGIEGVPGATPTAGVGGGLGTLTQSGGVINVNGALNVGVGGATTLFGGSSGYYYINGGTLNDGTTVNNFILVGNGSFVTGNIIQTAGTVNSLGSIILGRNAGAGTWNLQGGTVSITNDLCLGSFSAGSFIQSGGTVAITNGQIPGTTTYSGGNVNIGAGTVTSLGLYSMNAGSLIMTKNSSATTFQSSINTSIIVGNVGQGTFDQSGTAFVSSPQFLQIARSGGNGTYTMRGGTLSLGSLDIGNSGTALFSQSGGTTTIANNITLARGTVSTSGQMTVSGGTLQAGSMIFGASGTNPTPVATLNSSASFTQSGGQVSITGDINTGSIVSSSIALSGGTLSAGGLVNGSGGTVGETRAITVSGGTLLLGSINFGGSASTLTRFFNQSDGTVLVNNTANAGTIATGQNSTFNITGGTFTVTGGITTNSNSTVSFTGAQTHVSIGTFNLGATTVTLGAPDIKISSATFGSGSAVNVTAPLSLNTNLIYGTTSVAVDPGVTFALTGPISTTSARILTKGGNGTLTISGPQTQFLGSGYQTNAGVLNLASNAGTNAKVIANGGVTNFTAQQTLGSISINAGGLVALSAPAGTVHGAATFTIAGNTVPTGTLDIGRNGLVINYTPGSSPMTNVAAQVASGFHGGDFNGPGIRSSSASFSGAHPTAVGYAEASAVGLTTSVGGVATDADSIIIRETFAGDADLDLTVNTPDFTLLSQNFNSTNATWSQGDFNYDGRVNALDFNLLAINFGQPNPTPALGSLVPEPMSMGIALGMVGLGTRRRRR